MFCVSGSRPACKKGKRRNFNIRHSLKMQRHTGCLRRYLVSSLFIVVAVDWKQFKLLSCLYCLIRFNNAHPIRKSPVLTSICDTVAIPYWSLSNKWCRENASALINVNIFQRLVAVSPATEQKISYIKTALQDSRTAHVIKDPNKAFLVEITHFQTERERKREVEWNFERVSYPPPHPPVSKERFM